MFMGKLVEYAPTQQLFVTPTHEDSADYIERNVSMALRHRFGEIRVAKQPRVLRRQHRAEG
jgi:hypothetical protein